MALKVLQPGGNPLGQFDGVDAAVSSILGGEVVTFTTATASTDKAAADKADGYINSSTLRVAVGLASGVLTPFMLADDGTANYGTLLGSVIGGVAGQTTTGTALGPHTAYASGKITCWDKPGLYGVTLDAVDQNASTGLQPTNTTLAPGNKLFVASSGILTPNSSASGASASAWAGRFVCFETNMSLVTTPNRLVAALNSPTGTSSSPTITYTMAVFNFHPTE